MHSWLVLTGGLIVAALSVSLMVVGVRGELKWAVAGGVALSGMALYLMLNAVAPPGWPRDVFGYLFLLHFLVWTFLDFRLYLRWRRETR